MIDFKKIPKDIVRQGNARPAFAFEKITGIQGVAGRYHFPVIADTDGRLIRLTPFKVMLWCRYVFLRTRAGAPGVRIDLAQKISKAEGEAMLMPIFKAMMAANPEMADLVHQRYEQKHHILSGMASGFNKDDIASFLMGQYFYIVAKNPDYAKALSEVQRLSDIEHLNWVPAHKTLKHMATELRKKHEQQLKKPPMKPA